MWDYTAFSTLTSLYEPPPAGVRELAWLTKTLTWLARFLSRNERKHRSASRMRGQVSNSLTLIRTFSPNSTDFALVIAKTCLRFPLEYESKAVCFLLSGITKYILSLHSESTKCSRPWLAVRRPRKEAPHTAPPPAAAERDAGLVLNQNASKFLL